MFREFSRTRSYFRTLHLREPRIRNVDRCTGCALSYPQLWIELCILGATSQKILRIGVFAGSNALAE